MKKILIAASLALAAVTAFAQAWPTAKSITIVVPFPPGGSTDMIARVLAAGMPARLGGANIVVDNRAGATGTIGAAQVARAPADGYTLLVASLGPFVIAPHLMKVPYDALKDLDPVSIAVQAPNVLAVPTNSPHKSLADVIAFHRANPGKMTFASAGNGSSDHLTAELFWQETKTKGVHVPYKGGAPALTDLLGGQVDATFMNINTGIPYIKGGKLRALAITSSKRSPLLPDVPTMEELGYKGVTVTSWQAMAAPKGLPADIKARLQAAIVATLNDPAVKGKLLDLGFEVLANTPEQFAAFEAVESARWKKVIETGNIKAD